jgi:Ca2+-binding RTX toxin-like protein
MARITASQAVDIDTFTLSTHYANAATKVMQTGTFNVGIRAYENMLSFTDTAPTPDVRVQSHFDNVTFNGSGVVTGGSLHSIMVQNATATSFATGLRFSSLDASATQYIAALSTATGTDDRAFVGTLMAGADTITLGSQNDHWDAFEGNDTMSGNAGNDSLRGADGNDSIDGGIGNDTVRGSDQNDTVIGNRGTDWVYGGADQDIVRGGDGNDMLFGGSGSDTFDFKAGDDADLIMDYNDVEDFIRVDVTNPTTPGWTETQVGADVLVEVNGLKITIVDATTSQIDNGDFIWV